MGGRIGQSDCITLFAAFLLMIVAVLFPGRAMADGVNGFVDLTWSNASTKTTDATGQSTKTDVNSYFQRYNLQIDKTLYPKLRLAMAGVYEKDTATIKGDTTETSSTNTRFRPWITLTLADPLYTAGVGYYLREAKQEASQAATVTTVSEDYNAVLGWKPAGLPSLDLKYTRSYLYDRDRVIQDATRDNVFLASQYTYRGLDLRYSGTYAGTNDVLHGQETRDVSHNGRGSYADSFLNGRLAFSTSYNIVHAVTSVSSTGSGTGMVSTQLFPSGGLSALDDTPATGALDPNPALIDGDLTASSGVNIGGRPRTAGDARARNLGLDFLTATEVNNLLVWVDRELTTDVAASFSWDIYTSTDNLNWTFYTTIATAPFGPFQNRFDLDFPSVRARYIKAVVRPLQPTVIGASGFPDIFVTELQAFVKQSTGAREETFTSGSQVSNTALRYRIFEAPLLYYDASYYFARKDPSAQEITTLSNGFSASHRFNEIFSGAARVAREDGSELGEQRTAYVYNASLMAVPVRALTNSLVFSGRNETVGQHSRSLLSLFLNNTAQVYRGIDANLNGGVTSSTETDGTELKTAQITLGTNIVPHRTMTANLYLTHIKTDQSRPTGELISTATRTVNLNVAYNPYPTLYLSAAMQMIDESGQGVKTLQNYGLNWAPFPDGAFQFRFSYLESRRQEDQSTDRIISPGLRYKINNRSFLDVSYQAIQNDSASQTIESQIVTANLKIFI